MLPCRPHESLKKLRLGRRTPDIPPELLPARNDGCTPRRSCPPRPPHPSIPHAFLRVSTVLGLFAQPPPRRQVSPPRIGRLARAYRSLDLSPRFRRFSWLRAHWEKECRRREALRSNDQPSVPRDRRWCRARSRVLSLWLHEIILPGADAAPGAGKTKRRAGAARKI